MRQYDKANNFRFWKATFIFFIVIFEINRSLVVQFSSMFFFCSISMFIVPMCVPYSAKHHSIEISNWKSFVTKNWWNNVRLFEQLLWRILFLFASFSICMRERPLFSGSLKMGTPLIWFTKQWFEMKLFCVPFLDCEMYILFYFAFVVVDICYISLNNIDSFSDSLIEQMLVMMTLNLILWMVPKCRSIWVTAM